MSDDYEPFIPRLEHDGDRFHMDSLCQSCNDVFDYLRSGDEVGTTGFQRQRADVEKTAKEGCHACIIFAANFDLMESKEYIEAFKTAAQVHITYSELFYPPSMLIPWSSTPMRYLLQPSSVVDPLIRAAAIEPNTGSEATLNLAGAWMETCTAHHLSCATTQTSSQVFPTRVLYLDEDIKSLSLLERHEAPLALEYATLSHCWGGKVDNVLTRTSYEVFRSGLPITTLAQTFQDAAYVALKLGFRYIWIDCFCIIQDDDDDWTQQAPLMRYIYAGSALNIAAAASKDSSGGLFRDREPSVALPLKIPIILSAESTVTDYYLTDLRLYWDRFERAPLNARAWTLQERLLSPRTLHFDSDQIVWECNELIACERFPGGVGNIVPDSKILRKRFRPVRRDDINLDVPGQLIKDMWQPIVRDYSARGLTKDTDRVVALHGVSVRASRALDCNFAAGLMSRLVESQLTWRARDNQMTTRPSKTIAPSWSWLSVLGPVDFMPQWDDTEGEQPERRLKPEDLQEQYLCEIINIDYFGDEDASALSSQQKLLVRGWLAAIYFPSVHDVGQWQSSEYKIDHVAQEDGTEEGTGTAGAPSHELWPLCGLRGGTVQMWDGATSSAGAILVTDMDGKQSGLLPLDLAFDVAEECRTSMKLWIFPVMSVTQAEAVDFFDMHRVQATHGLILGQSDQDKSVFRRLGTFKVRRQHSPDLVDFWASILAFKDDEINMASYPGVLTPVMPTQAAERKSSAHQERLDSVLNRRGIPRKDYAAGRGIAYERTKQEQYVITIE